MYKYDKRIVMTLDAGGTNFVFSAIQANQEVIEPIRFAASADDLEKCLNTLVEGFNQVKSKLSEEPVAISFAFPGPANYPKGIIGDLPNFPSFRGGIALGPFLEHQFGLPVFINNDGDLFAYGEAVAGALPTINARLKNAGSTRQYKNLLGFTLGTGFGAGVVVNNQLLIGDNSDGGNVWNNRNKKFTDLITEESVSIRAVQRVYSQKSGDNDFHTPKDIFDIAEGTAQGDRCAAISAFEELGEMAGDTIAHATNLIDGIIVIGGGLAGAKKYIVPAMVREMTTPTGTFSGDSFPRMCVRVIDLSENFDELLTSKTNKIQIPMTDIMIDNAPERLTGIYVSDLGASKAISLGAYAFALNQIDQLENQ